MAWIIQSVEDRLRYQLGDLHLRLIATEQENEDLKQEVETKNAEIEKKNAEIEQLKNKANYDLD